MLGNLLGSLFLANADRLFLAPAAGIIEVCPLLCCRALLE
jgi:hypothetical protein